ncbi:MAG: GIY-YIG nuclease family protein [Saprospiraceae bacterium]|nr:GIY-YIG nuclease family protein [Saprospiraceae bacterium]
MKRKYAVVDLETTGGIPKRDKITEIAIIIFDGEKIIDEYQSLINPERSIPPNITRITGITNEMVEDAPKFYEVAKQVVEITEGTIFVAHNVRFDYQFLREEFSNLGFTFTRRNLCTVKLSRKVFPGLDSYALGSLIRYFKIEVENRHRAYDDAWATTILLQKIFEKQNTKKAVNSLITETIKLTKLPPALTMDDIENLPEKCGVYYFSNKYNDVIYVGKSINIQKRVRQHFSKQTRKADKLLTQVAKIAFEITGSELLSLLKESHDIKNIQPPINKAQKTRWYKYAIIVDEDKSGYYKYKVVKADSAESPLSYYGSRKAAQQHIQQIGDSFQLCHKINGIDKSNQACFNFGVGKCMGACIGEEFPISYNERFKESQLLVNRLFDENFIVMEEGRSQDERAIFLVEEGHYKGHGFINLMDAQYGIEELKECIKYEPLNPEADLILRNYIWSNPKVDLTYF